MAGGMRGGGEHAWQGGHAWQGCVAGAVFMAGGHAYQGVCGGGHAWQILRDMVNERAVRFLLECILVIFIFQILVSSIHMDFFIGQYFL